MSETRQSCYLSRANVERFKWKMNSNYTVHRLSYHSAISLLKVTSGKKKKKETLSGKSMFPGRRERSRTSEGAGEGDKSVKPDICARTSANNDSCASNIDSKIEQRFKRKFAYLIWTSAYQQCWPSWLQAEHLQAWCHRKYSLFVF